MVDVTIPSDGSIRKKEHEKLKKYQGLKEELEKMWSVKATVVPIVKEALGTVKIKPEYAITIICWTMHVSAVVPQSKKL